MKDPKKTYAKNYVPFHSYKLELLNERTQVCFVNLNSEDVKRVRVSLNFQRSANKTLKKTLGYGQKLFEMSLVIEQAQKNLNTEILRVYESIRRSRTFFGLSFAFKAVCLALYLAFSFLAIKKLYTGSSNKDWI